MNRLAKLLVVALTLFHDLFIGIALASQDHEHRELQEDPALAWIIARYGNADGAAYIESVAYNNSVAITLEQFRLSAFQVEEENLDTILADLNANDDIEGAIGDFDRTAIGLPDQAGEIIPGRLLSESIQYGIKQVQADQLFDIAGEAPGKVNVCVVDTGTQDGHEDLPSTENTGMTGTDGFEVPLIAGTWYDEGNGHGTHCAGVIGAIGGNGKGVVGVRKNPDLFTFHIGKGLNDNGAGRSSNIFTAVVGCYEQEAKVISMSLGGPAFSPVEELIYDFLFEEGYLVIAAAGNDGNSEYSFPASYRSVVSVAAVDEDKRHASFSQYNDQVELSGPGVNVLSTFIGNDYRRLSGTSMATPHVAGVAAEVWSHFPDCSNLQIRNVLIRSAEDAGEEGYDVFYGYGIVQAKAAYDLLKAEGCEAGGPATDDPLSGSFGGCMQGLNQTKDCDNLSTSPATDAQVHLASFGALVLSTILLMTNHAI